MLNNAANKMLRIGRRLNVFEELFNIRTDLIHKMLWIALAYVCAITQDLPNTVHGKKVETAAFL